MFYGNNIQDTRQLFYSSWNKYLQKQVLLPLEEAIALEERVLERGKPLDGARQKDGHHVRHWRRRRPSGVGSGLNRRRCAVKVRRGRARADTL